MHIYNFIPNLGVGGGQSAMFEMCLAFKKYYPEIKQTIICNTPPGDRSFIESYGLKFRVLDNQDTVNLINSNANSNPVVVVNKLHKTNVNFVRYIDKNIPKIIISHTYTKEPNFNKIDYGDAVVYVSEAMRAIASPHCKVKKKTVILNSISGEKFEKIKPVDKDLNFFYTGRINNFNQIKFSTQWLSWINSFNFNKPVRHYYIGSGNQFEHAKEFLKKTKQNKNQIFLTGNISNLEKKMSMLKSWDIYLYGINPNHCEGTSIGILEALSVGVPVIVNDRPSNPELIKNGVNGYVYKDQREAEGIIGDLIKDPKALLQLRESTLKHFNKHMDIKHNIKKYLDLFSSIKNQK